MASGRCRRKARMMSSDGLLDAEVHHCVAVVRQDDVDEVLADVVDVALDGGKDDGAAGGGVGLLHELFEMTDCGLHRFSRLEDFGDDQLVVIEEPADFGHAGHERAVDDIERGCAFGALEIEVGDEAVLGAFDDVVGEALIERDIGRLFLLALAGFAEVIGDGGDVELVDGDFFFARLGAPVFGGGAEEIVAGVIGGDGGGRGVEEKMLGEAALVFRDGGVSFQLFGVDDGEVKAGFGGVIKEYGVDHFAGGGGEAEADVGDAEDGFDEGDFALDEADGFDGFDGSADVILIAGGAGEDQRIDDDVLGRDAVFIGEQIDGAAGDGEFALADEGLRLEFVFVDSSADESRAVGFGERRDALEFFLAVFEIDGVDDAFALAVSEGEFHRGGVGGVDHDGGFGFADELFVEDGDVADFVAVGGLKADVDDVRAVADLPAGDLGGLLPFLRGDHVFEEAGADDVGALADDEGAVRILGFD